MLKPLTAAPSLRHGRLPSRGSRREPTNSAYNLAPSTQSEPFGPKKHRTDNLRQCRRRRSRRGERANISIASVSSSNSPCCHSGLTHSVMRATVFQRSLATLSWSEHTLARHAFGSHQARNRCLHIHVFHL